MEKEMIINENSSQYEMAQYLGDQGFEVFPLFQPIIEKDGTSRCSCNNPFCRSIGKHPRITDWQNKATMDISSIDMFWGRYPSSNIGILTGSGLLVVDVDPRNNGNETLKKLLDKHGPFPETFTVDTGGGGKHFYFEYDANIKIPCRNNGLGDGIDIKADGGYVVGPGSLHASGLFYEFAENTALEHVEIAELPGWIMGELAAKHKTKGSEGIIHEGKRNDTLASIAGRYRSNGLEVEEITKLLLSVNDERCQPPLAAEEVEGIARSIGKYSGNVTPFRNCTAEPLNQGDSFKLSDSGNAERLVCRHGDKIRFCPRNKMWFYFDGTKWKEDVDNVLTLYAKETARSIAEEAKTFGLSDKGKEKIADFALKSENKDKIRSMIDLAKSEPTIPLDYESFNQNRWMFNVANGTLDLKNGALLPHCKEHLISKLADVEYDKDAGCPMFLKFLDQIFENDKDLIGFIKRLAGYSMTGLTSEQILVILYGTGANGKTTLLNVLMSLFGEYGKTASSDTFLSKKHSSMSNDLAALAGSRLVTISEIDHGKTLSEALVKNVTGGDAVTARFLFREYFSYIPAYQIMMATNAKPKIHGSDNGIWRRLKLIPFNVQIPKDEQDLRLGEKLAEELPGILNWAIEGCLEWQELGGLDYPGSIERATDEYHDEMNLFQDFINETCLTASKNDLCPAGELYNRYSSWASNNNEKAMSKSDFKKEMTVNGYSQVKKASGNYWVGLVLKKIADEMMDSINLEG